MNTTAKIKTLEELVPIVLELRNAGKRIVTTNGCFDIVHPGHITGLEWAKSQGDVLIVGLNTDRSVREIKGPLRPILSEGDRAQVLAALGAVDYVFLFDDRTPEPWLKLLMPHVHVKSSDYTLEQVVERTIVERGGGEVRLAPKIEGRSTTGIIEIIRERYGK
jgi:rfaE bifunctional protein nucleotidyltransferase chain/domain